MVCFCSFEGSLVAPMGGQESQTPWGRVLGWCHVSVEHVVLLLREQHGLRYAMDHCWGSCAREDAGCGVGGMGTVFEAWMLRTCGREWDLRGLVMRLRGVVGEKSSMMLGLAIGVMSIFNCIVSIRI